MSKRTEPLYLRDMKEAAEAVLSYTQGVTFEDFKNDRMRHAAVIREFQIIGEAVGKLGDSIKQAYPHIAWQDIKDFRNLLIHEYFGVDLEIVWNVVQQDLPALYETIQAIEENLEKDFSQEPE